MRLAVVKIDAFLREGDLIWIRLPRLGQPLYVACAMQAPPPQPRIGSLILAFGCCCCSADTV
jgi:hypothetical protein